MVEALRTLLHGLPPGSTVYLQAGATEQVLLHAPFAAAGARTSGLHLFTALVPGLNDHDYAAALPGASLATLLLPPALREGFAAGRVGCWPTTYAGAAERLARTPFDLAIVPVAPPVDGRAALGLTADFAPLIWPLARRRLLIINPDMPVPAGTATIDAALADAVIELSGAIPTLAPAPPTAISAAIAGHVAAYISDGATLQIGIGRVPDAMAGALGSRRGLKLHSGAIGDGLIALAEAGALASGAVHRIGSVVGSPALHRFVVDHNLLRIVDTRETRGIRVLAALDGFVSVNSALQVDLFGQANLEWRRGRLNGGVGGAPDFIRGARAARGGRSILALPARIGAESRIVARLDNPTVSIPATDADLIVTEHGSAAIRDLALDRRAEALIAIAAPEHHASLDEAWRRMRAEM